MKAVLTNSFFYYKKLFKQNNYLFSNDFLEKNKIHIPDFLFLL